jgi:hypothetical protein
MEIRQVEDTVYTSVQDVSEELPDNTPRYILLSYPLTLVGGLSRMLCHPGVHWSRHKVS